MKLISKWIMVITLLIISSDVFSQIRGTTWGDSWEQVKETIDDLQFGSMVDEQLFFDLRVTEHSKRAVDYLTFQLTDGDTTGIRYLLLDDKLASIQLNFDFRKISLVHFKEKAELLSRKYGNPTGDYIDNEPTEAIDNWNKILDKSLEKGKILIERKWIQDDILIKLSMGSMADNLVFQIQYWTPLLYDDLIAEWNRIKINDS